ncbi:hypothetical protein [Sorangium sp. So ce233]|uniref:hypothetical protein n=1 Tax=Sorangium sp. So ce233 TaxID=3133290 RepID=UPI003F61E9EA
MDLKLNGAVLQSYRTSAVGVLQFVLTASLAIASTSTDQPALLFWAVMVSAGANLLIGLLSADHARIAKGIADGIAAWEELQRQRQAKAGAPPPVAIGAPVPELEVPFSGEAGAPQDTIPEAPPVAVPASPKEPLR